MFQTRIAAILCALAATVTLSIVLTGCGSSSANATQNTMSQAQAQAVAGEISLAVSQGLQSATGLTVSSQAKNDRPGLSAFVQDLHPDQATGCTETSNGSENCYFPVSSNDSQPCTDGGTINVSGDISGTLTNSNGSLQVALSMVPVNCAVDGVVINGNTIAATGQITLTNSAPVLPIIISENGNIAFSGQSCPVSLTYTVSSETSCTMSGTACGVAVSGPC